MAQTLGEVLKQARLKRQLSLRAVERATGIKNAHVSQIESGTISKPEMALLWELAGLYGLDYTHLLVLAGYGAGEESSGRQRRRMSVAMRAMGDLSPKQQDEALKYMAELRAGKRDD